MNKNKKKGFTLVELLVVIAIIAILATVSIIGYTSFTKKAKESVYQQEKTQQQIADLAAQVDNLDLLTWDKVEEAVKNGIESAKTNNSVDESQVRNIVNNAVKGITNSLLTKEQIVKIVNHSLDGINTGLSEDKIKEIVEEAINSALEGATSTEVNLGTIVNFMSEGGDFILSEDIIIGNSLEISEGKNSKLDLNKKTIKTIGERNSFVVNPGSSVSFSNGTIVNDAENEGPNDPKYAITGYNGSTIILDGVHITGSNNRAVGVLMGTVVVSCSDSTIDGYIFIDLGTVVLAHEGTYRITSEMFQCGVAEPNIDTATGYNIQSKIRKTGTDGIFYYECIVVKN